MASSSDLTTREIEILQLVIAGKTNKTIASEIRLGEKQLSFTSTTSSQSSMRVRA